MLEDALGLLAVVGGGVAVLEALARLEDRPDVLALSVSDTAADVVPMIRAGALGYVTKTIDTADLLRAIDTVGAGEASPSARAWRPLSCRRSLPAASVPAPTSSRR